MHVLLLLLLSLVASDPPQATWARAEHEKHRSLSYSSIVALPDGRTPINLTFYYEPMRTTELTGAIGFQLEFRKTEAAKQFHFGLFEGPDAPSHAHKLMRVTVIRNGKPTLSVSLSPQGWYAVDGGFTFELSDVFDEPHSVARKILDALSEKSEDLQIRITDDQNQNVALEVTVPTAGREKDFQWLLRKESVMTTASPSALHRPG